MRIRALMKCFSIVSGNGLSPARRQAITWTNTDRPLIGPSSIGQFTDIYALHRNNIQWNWIQIHKFAFKNNELDYVCSMPVIFLRTLCWKRHVRSNHEKQMILAFCVVMLHNWNNSSDFSTMLFDNIGDNAIVITFYSSGICTNQSLYYRHTQ